MNPGAVEVCDDGLDNDCSGDAPECTLPETADVVDDGDHTLGASDGGAFDYLDRNDVTVLDLDGDGHDDVVAGAFGDDDGGNAAGAVYFWYGGTSLGAVAAAESAKVVSGTAYSSLGHRTAHAGDVNADGYADVLLSAYNTDSVYLWFGAATAVSGSIDIDARVTAGLAAELGVTSAYQFGYEVNGVGDVNDDGYDDILVVDFSDNAAYAGEAYLVMGAASGLTGVLSAETAATAVFTEGQAGDYFGYVNGSAGGDFNGDGYADVVVGEWGNDLGSGQAFAGRAYLFAGPASGTTAGTAADVTFSGSAAGDYMGKVVENIGDWNGDGFDDLAVGAGGYDGGASGGGGVFVYFGATSWTSSLGPSDADVELTASSAAGLGHPHHIGDLDGDGVDDLAVGAPDHERAASAYSATGYAGIFLGVSGSAGGTFDLEADADHAFLGADDESGQYVGSEVGAGDLDGDGRRDLLVGDFDENGSQGAISIFRGSGM